MRIAEKTGLPEKLRILPDAAEYDAACTSGGRDSSRPLPGFFRTIVINKIKRGILESRQVYLSLRLPYLEDYVEECCAKDGKRKAIADVA